MARTRKRGNRMSIAQEALQRAVQSPSMANYPAIFAGFMAKGIPEADIHPRENVFSFHAWKALGRSVKKGEHGVRITTVRKGERTDKETGEKVAFSSPWFVTVFHVTQTRRIDGSDDTGTPEVREAKPEPIAQQRFDTKAEPASRQPSENGFSYYSEEFTEKG